MKRKAKAKPKALKKSKPKEEDWLGDEAEGENQLDLGSDDEAEDHFEGEEDEGDVEPEDDAAAMDDDNEAGDAQMGSRIPARVAEGKQMDLSALKQEIQDDAGLLSNWRKAQLLGEKRSREEVFKNLVSNCSTYFGYSEELAEYFLQMFSPETAVKFFEANEQQRPLTLRTNTLKARRSSLMQALTQRKVQVDPIGSWTKVGLKVYQSQVPVGATPEYLGGHYMIQSASSFIPVMALAPQQDEVVLDMAAAPGGKTTYIGQLMRNSGTLFANDLRKDRCKALVANVHRLGLTNVVVTNLDGKKLSKMLPRLDRVLLDAPCTGSGIIARDPSVKVKRGQKDFEGHSRLQKELLTAAIDMVDAGSKTGGYIVYSTCSVAVEENEAVVDHALKTRNVELVSFTSAVNFGVEGLSKYRERRFHPSLNLSRRYYPHVHNMDGFFVAKLKKTSNKVPERIKKDRSKVEDKVWGEEHWTSDFMDSVVDFEETNGDSTAKKKKKMNARDRKKQRRDELLKARGYEQKYPPKPADSEAKEENKEPAAAAKGKKAKVKAKKKRSLEDVAPAEEAAKEAPRPKKVRKVKKAAKA